VISCDEALEAAMLQAAGDIDQVTRERLESHLLACAACGEQAGRIRRTIQLMLAEEAPDPGAEYWSAFDARLRGRILRERSVPGWRGVASLAAVAAIAVLGLWVWTAGHPRMAPPAAPGDSPAPHAGELPDEAEARLEEAIDRMALQEQGERSFETVLDEVLPATSPGYEADLEKPDLEPPQTQDNI
jgi:anti-sigma factor RsiW